MINSDLVKYIENNVMPLNEKNDSGHNVDHVNYVINRSLEFAKKIDNINLDMVYVIAAYHDVGHHIDAKNHECVSSIMFLKDSHMLDFFTIDEIKIISEAILEHRASNSSKPRSIYGKIVSSADRNTSVDDPLVRTYQYILKHSPDLSIDEMIERSRKHLIEKFGEFGYAKDKIYFDDKAYDEYLISLNKLLNDEKLFREKYILVNNISENV